MAQADSKGDATSEYAEAVVMIRQPRLFMPGTAFADRMKGEGQVDRDDGVPLFDRKLFGGHVLDTGVVDEDVQAADTFPSSAIISAISIDFHLRSGLALR